MPGGGGSVFTGAAGKIDQFPGSHPSRDLVDPIVAVETYLAGFLPTSFPIPGQILNTVYYTTAHSYSAVAGTMTALDTTNLTIAFTVPTNGIVDVDVWGGYGLTVTANQAGLYLALLNHTGGAQVGTVNTLAYDIVANTTDYSAFAVSFHLTGLSAGALQLDAAAMVMNVVGASGVINTGAGASSNANVPFKMQAKASI